MPLLWKQKIGKARIPLENKHKMNQKSMEVWNNHLFVLHYKPITNLSTNGTTK